MFNTNINTQTLDMQVEDVLHLLVTKLKQTVDKMYCAESIIKLVHHLDDDAPEKVVAHEIVTEQIGSELYNEALSNVAPAKPEPAAPPAAPPAAVKPVPVLTPIEVFRVRLEKDEHLQAMYSNIIEYLKGTMGAAGVLDIKVNDIIDLPMLLSIYDSTIAVSKQANLLCLNPLGGEYHVLPNNARSLWESVHRKKLVNIPHTAENASIDSKTENKIIDGVHKQITNYLTGYKTCKKMKYEVDMFATSSSMKECEGTAYITHSFKTPKVEKVEPEIVSQVMNDYVNHFAIFRQFIDFVVASRLSSDRRNCYLWIHADSGWGKGFLYAIFEKMNMIQELSVKEIEKAFEGNPVGRSPEAFSKSWVTAFDEFKMVKSELKQLNNKIALSPKFEMTAEAPVYLKLFTSAESVDNLCGSAGVEEQFAKRFAYYRPETPSIEDSALFKSLGKALYLDALVVGVLGWITEEVEKYRKLGRYGADKAAEKVINAFHQEHSITNSFASLEDTITELAEDFRKYATDKSTILSGTTEGNFIRDNSTFGSIGDVNVMVLRKPTRVLEDWLQPEVERGQYRKVMYKMQSILKQASHTGEYNKSTRIKLPSGESVVNKGVVLRVDDD